MKKQLLALAGVTAAVILFAGCSATNIDCDYKGIQAKDGQPIAYVHTSNAAMHFIGTYPMIGDATMRTTFEDFKKEAKRLNGTKVRITTTTKEYNFNYFPLFGFIFPICTSEVAGEVYP